MISPTMAGAVSLLLRCLVLEAMRESGPFPVFGQVGDFVCTAALLWTARPGPGCLPLLASARLEDFQNEAEGAQPVDLAEPLG